MNTFASITDRPPAAATPSAADLDAIKAKQRATWASGDFSIIGTTLQIVGEALCEAVDLRSGSKVLDVAAGNGNCSLAAARRFCDVTSTDYVPALLEDGAVAPKPSGCRSHSRKRMRGRCHFATNRSTLLSSFGVMFTPNHTRAASELLRVCRREGRIGLANWAPRGFIGRLFAVVGRHKAFAGLSADGQRRLEQDLISLINDFNSSGDSTMVVPSEYVEVVIVKK
jgi:hypothetical protein